MAPFGDVTHVLTRTAGASMPASSAAGQPGDCSSLSGW
jgi:hypothetical protein